MKKMQRFWWTLLLLLTAVWLTVNDGWQRDATFAQQPTEQLAPTAVLSTHDSRHQEATLTDATSLYRVCSSRPQRLLPTHGSKPERTANPCGAVRRHIVKPLHFLHDSRRRLETAPFCLPASCLYYVIALRHIIR